MNVEQLEAKVKVLEERLQIQEDIEAIQKLEAAYSFYLEHVLYNEMADLWADDGVLEWLGMGRWRGKEVIRKHWSGYEEWAKRMGTKLIHPGPRFCGYVTVNPDGKTAAGRWYVAGVQNGMEMLCENRYVKENGVWKFSLLSVGGFPYHRGKDFQLATDADQERALYQMEKVFMKVPFTERIPRVPRQEDLNYLRPFSFKHPVTGKDVNKTVGAWNKTHPCEMPPGGEKWTAGK